MPSFAGRLNVPFRFGVSVSSPTFYKLTTSNYTYVTDDRLSFDNKGINDSRDRSNYKFKLHTPWKFGASLGHTIGEQVALGLSYEYADYGTIDSRYITDEYYYDYYTDSYSDRSSSDRVMNQHSKRTLKGVHTIKVGGEFRPVPEMAVRLGYNYVSPMYDKEGFKDGTLDSDASFEDHVSGCDRDILDLEHLGDFESVTVEPDHSVDLGGIGASVLVHDEAVAGKDRLLLTSRGLKDVALYIVSVNAVLCLVVERDLVAFVHAERHVIQDASVTITL